MCAKLMWKVFYTHDINSDYSDSSIIVEAPNRNMAIAVVAEKLRKESNLKVIGVEQIFEE